MKKPTAQNDAVATRYPLRHPPTPDIIAGYSGRDSSGRYVGQGNGGTAAGPTPGGQPANGPQAKEQKYKQCMSNYNSSAMGKEGAFWDPVRNLEETLGLIGLKFGGLFGINAGSKAFPAVEVPSILVKGNVQRVAGGAEVATEGWISLLKEGSPYFTLTAAFFTLSDLTAQATCRDLAYGIDPAQTVP